MVKANPSWVARVWTNVEIDDYIQAHIAGHDWNLIKVDESPFSFSSSSFLFVALAVGGIRLPSPLEGLPGGGRIWVALAS